MFGLDRVTEYLELEYILFVGEALNFPQDRSDAREFSVGIKKEGVRQVKLVDINISESVFLLELQGDTSSGRDLFVVFLIM